MKTSTIICVNVPSGRAAISFSVIPDRPARKKKEELKTYKVTVNGNPGYCGEGAGGAQFAHGEALITSERLAKWFGEHEGYTVTEIKTDSNDGTPGEQ